MTQRDEAWFRLKAGKISGSRFGDLMATIAGGKPAASRRNLIATLACERMTGVYVDGYRNAAMDRGVELEEEARQAYEVRIGALVEEADFITHETLPNVGVSPDGLVGEDGLVEVKCPSAMGKHLDALLTGDHAREYHWQVQGQLWVTARSWCDVVSYDPRWPEPMRLAVVRVHRGENDIVRLEEACIKAEAEIEERVRELTVTYLKAAA